MTLKEWITKVGDAEAAKRLGIKERTVKSWRLGERMPRPAKVRDIAKITGNRVSFKECF
jgi:DNA-binding transcriptional regulator YdaS (Cro superfamily)